MAEDEQTEDAHGEEAAHVAAYQARESKLRRAGEKAMAFEAREDEWDQQRWRTNGYKKFDEIMVAGESARERVKVWFNRKDESWGASLRGMTFLAGSMAALEGALGRHLRQSEVYQFSRYLTVDYTRTAESHRGRHPGTKSWSGGRRSTAASEEIAWIGLEFDVWDVSQPFNSSPPYAADAAESVPCRVWRRMELDESAEWRAVEDDVVLSEERASRKLIPFTHARFRLLVSIKRAIQEIDAKLVAVLGEDVADPAAAIDSLAMLAISIGSDIVLLDEPDGRGEDQ